MECEREMTDGERLREMVKHTVANVIEQLGQAMMETREAEPDRPLLGTMLREAEMHLFVARTIELGQGMTEEELLAENARLRARIEELEANRLAGFRDDELYVFTMYCLENLNYEVKAELARREEEA